MYALAGSAIQLWPWLGVAAWGSAAALPLVTATESGLVWLLLAALPFGLLLYALALVPAFATVPPAAAPAVAAIAGLVSLGGAAVLCRGRSRMVLAILPADVAAAGFLVLVMALVARGAARYGSAVTLAVPLPPALGEPSTGDLGLHVLRAALIARSGVPPPSPLDPDYPLQYRYLFHVLAAAFILPSSGETARITIAVGGLIAGSLVPAGAYLAYLCTRSRWPALSAGVLAALSGPTYWLADAWSMLWRGQWPAFPRFDALMGGEWSLSPFTPSFPSVMSAQGSSPGIPMAVLCWLGVLVSLSAAAGGTGVAAALAAVAGGLCLAELAFTADFYLPLILAALALALVIVRFRTTPCAAHSLPGIVRSRDTRCARGAMRQQAGAQARLVAGVLGLGAGLLLLFGASRQVGGAGAATSVGLAWNKWLAAIPVYGGNHALLDGGQPLPLPNWVIVHDWGLWFWLGLIVILAGGWRRRDPALMAGGVASLAGLVFWQLCTVTFGGQVEGARVQMYRYASLASSFAAPLIPAGWYGCLRPLWPVPGWAGWRHAGWRVACALSLLPVVGVGAGAGGYLLAGISSVDVRPPPRYLGQIALARTLAQQGGINRLAVIGGPASFVEMYNSDRGGYLPLWWGHAAAAVPVGWDFGHPEVYQPLYRRVVRDLDPAAAAQLGLTHVAVDREQLDPDSWPRLRAFLTQCHAVLLAAWPEGAAGAQLPPDRGQALYRLDARACGSGQYG